MRASPKPAVEIHCAQCGRKYLRFPSLVREKNFCNIACRSAWLKEHFQGNNNPNFGKRWSEEKRAEQSVIVRSSMKDPVVLHKVGSARRGKTFTFSDKHKKNMSKAKLGVHFSETHRKNIGKASKAKFTKDFKNKLRKTMEDRGHWLPEKSKSPYSVYFKEADWDLPMWDYSCAKFKKTRSIPLYK